MQTTEKTLSRLDAMSRAYEDAVAAINKKLEPEKYKFMVHELHHVSRATSLILETRQTIFPNIAGRWLIRSQSRDNNTYRVTSHTCTCEAGLNGKMCKHQVIAQCLDELDNES